MTEAEMRDRVRAAVCSAPVVDFKAALRDGWHYLLQDPLEEGPLLVRWNGEAFAYADCVRYYPAPGQRWVCIEAHHEAARRRDGELEA